MLMRLNWDHFVIVLEQWIDPHKYILYYELATQKWFSESLHFDNESGMTPVKQNKKRFLMQVKKKT